MQLIGDQPICRKPGEPQVGSGRDVLDELDALPERARLALDGRGTKPADIVDEAAY